MSPVFKDLSELHNAAVESGQPEMFDKVIDAAVWKARLNQKRRREGFTSTSDPIPWESDGNKSFPAYTIGEIKDQVGGDNEQGWLCPLFMKAGEITLLGGEAKRSGKTTFIMHALKAVHDGVPFLGMPTLKTNSLVLTEQGNNILEATNKARIADDDRIFITPYKDVSKEAWPKLIERAVLHCKENDLGILIVDTFTAFARLRGSDENLSGEIIERMEPILDASRVHGLHVSVLHHTGYNGEIRGSSAFWKDPDAIWILKRPPGDHGPNVRALHGEGRYDTVNTGFNIALEDDGYVLLGTNSQIERSKAKQELLKEIPIGEEHPRRRTEVFKALAGRASEPTLRRALEDLIKANAVREKTLKGKGNPKVLWKPPGKPVKPEPHDLFPSNPQGMGSEFDVNRKSACLQEQHDYAETPLRDRVDGDGGAKKPGRKVPKPIGSSDGLAELVEAVRPAEMVALDLETMPPENWIREVVAGYRGWRTSLKRKPTKDRQRKKWEDLKNKVYKRYAVEPATAQVRLVSLATHGGLNEVVDATRVDIGPLLDVLKTKTVIVHNASFDLSVLRERYGYIHEGPILDTQHLYILHHYADTGQRSVIRDGKWRLPDPTTTKVEIDGSGAKVGMTSLKAVVKKYLPNVELDKSGQKADWSIPDLSSDMVAYSLKDSDVLLDLAQTLTARLADIGMGDIVDLESRALTSKVWMERNGLPADKETAKSMSVRYEREAQAALEELSSFVEGDSSEWRWTKPAHVRAALESLGANIEDLDKTSKSGEPSIKGESLNKLRGPAKAVEFVAAYLKYQELRKRASDFVGKYVGMVRENGTIVGGYETVSTGRYRCKTPNLQQVPRKGELQTVEGMRVRDIFRARPGELLVVADFEQVELLLAATIAERESGTESKMLEVFRAGGGDIHRATAASVLGKDEDEVTKAERTLAKALNFGLIYGCSAESLLSTAVNVYGIKDMTLKDAKRYRKAFFAKYPEFVAWHDKVSKACKSGHEYATTPRGRRRKLPRWAKTGEVAFTTAVNHPVQGAGADAIKLTLAKLFEDRHNCPGNPTLNCSVHDEVILSVEADHAEAAKAWVERHMADAEREAVMDSSSPIHVDVEVRESWGGD